MTFKKAPVKKRSVALDLKILLRPNNGFGQLALNTIEELDKNIKEKKYIILALLR